MLLSYDELANKLDFNPDDEMFQHAGFKADDNKKTNHLSTFDER
jgi:hypothetical protein